MARRLRTSLWTRSFAKLARATVRAGTRAVQKATTQGIRQATKAAKVAAKKSAPRARKPAASAKPTASSAGWRSGAALGATGARRYRVYRPPGLRAPARLPLLVMLHGCHQDAAGFARSTRLQALALRAGFMLLFPDQDRLANAQGCWNWFDTRSGRAQAEAAMIVAAVDQACALHGADPARVAVAGLSAGAGMAALLALRYPERFCAVAMHSGIAPGTAHSTATALSAMQGRRHATALPATPDLPPLLVIQGTADHVVNRANGRAAAELWAAAVGAMPSAPRTVQRGARHPMQVTDYRRGRATLVSLCEVEGLGHAWSGGAASQPYGDARGPDASRLVWAFAARAFARVRQSAAKQ